MAALTSAQAAWGEGDDGVDGERAAPTGGPTSWFTVTKPARSSRATTIGGSVPHEQRSEDDTDARRVDHDADAERGEDQGRGRRPREALLRTEPLDFNLLNQGGPGSLRSCQ